jgi:hypothetical protein
MNRSNRTCNRLLFGAAALTVVLLTGAGRAAADDPRQPAFRAIAKELLAGIDGASLEDIPAAGGYGKPRIAVAPFPAGESGIAPAVAAEFNSWLLAELTHQGGGSYRFVARDTLRSVIRDMDALSELEKDAGGAAARLLRNARVDILVVGALRRDGPAARLSYKAVSVEDGIVFAATQPRWIALDAPPRMVAGRDFAPAPMPVVARDLPFQPPPRRPVYRAQRALLVLGFEPGPADGVMRPALRRAIGDFERSMGVAVTGRLTRPLMRHLRYRLQAEGKTALAFP